MDIFIDNYKIVNKYIYQTIPITINEFEENIQSIILKYDGSNVFKNVPFLIVLK